MQKSFIYLSLVCLSVIARADVFNNYYQQPEVQDNPSQKALTQGFYQDFWQTDPSTNFDKLIYEPVLQQSFYKDITLKTITGYGISGFTDNNQTKITPLIYLQNKFTYGSDDQLYYRLKLIKYYILQVEQCYANIKGNKDFLENQHGKRKQTKLEQELESNCTVFDIKRIIEGISSNDLINFSTTFSNKVASNSAQIALDKQAKLELPIIHRMLNNAYQKTRTALIRNFNKQYLDEHVLNSNDFIKADRLTDKAQINNIFNAFTNVISFNSDNLPVNIFPENSTKILLNGEIKNDLEPDQADKLKNYRQTKQSELARKRAHALELAKSFSILKQAAVSGLTTIVNERYAEGNSASKMSAISQRIDQNLNIESKQKLKATEILKQIRDNISLNNKLAYMRYLALEKNQLALTSVQIAQLKTLADQINEQFDGMNRIAIMIDAGDDMTHEIGAKPDVTEIK